MESKQTEKHLDTKELRREIVDREWEMFSGVKNVGGPAPCQSQKDMFYIMRESHLWPWPAELLESWRQDLEEARRQGRNLMTEKYARMMETTYPEEYESLAESLPSLSERSEALLDEIVPIVFQWEKEVRKLFPFINARGRALEQQTEGHGTAFDTYLRGELSVYSEKTLALYLREINELLSENKNENLIVYEHMMKLSGYESMEQAQEQMG